MTAAALKHPQPELFTQLFASRPDRADRSSLAATAIAVLFHAALIAFAVWASSQIRHAASKPAVDVVDLTFVPINTTQPTTDAPSSKLATQKSGPVPLDIPAEPLPFPGPIADLSAVSRGKDFAQPAATTSNGTGSSLPGSGTGSGASDAEGFRAVSIMPALLNAAEVRRALERNYPVALRDAGIGGKTMLWVYIDEAGKVVRAEVKESSGQRTLDDAALRVAPMMRFSPARIREAGVKVVVAVPVAFTAR